MSRKAPLSPYQPYRIASRGGTGSAVAFFRDPKTTLQVWSREHGYPGEHAYLEFHKKHFPGGLRFWRITDSSGDLGKKIVYDPAVAADKVRAHARHFVELVKDTLQQASARGPAVVCAALRRRAVRPLVVRRPAVARAGGARHGQGRRPDGDPRRNARHGAARGGGSRCRRARGARAAIIACG